MGRRRWGVTFLLVAGLLYAEPPEKTDEARFITYVSVGPSQMSSVSLPDEEGLSKLVTKMEFAARFACRGKKSPCHPAIVELRFISTSQKWVLKDAAHTLRIFINDQLFSWGGYSWSGERLSADEVRETAEIRVRPSSLEPIIEARTVKVEVDGDATFSFSDQNLSDARELVKQILPMDTQAP